MRSLSIIFLMTIAIWLTGCDLLEPGEGYRRQVVVAGVIEAGRQMTPVQLSWTIPADQRYDPEEVAIMDADVRVTHLESGEVIGFVAHGDGSYHPQARHVVVPQGTYRMEAMVPGVDELITAETRVPELFSIVNHPAETIEFGTGQGPELTITPGSSGEPSAVYFMRIHATAADSFFVAEVEPGTYRWKRAELPSTYGLTPFFASIFLTSDCTPKKDGTYSCDLDPAEIVGSALPIVNEARYEVDSDGALIVRVPWLGIGYYGPQELAINSLSAELADFLETQGIQEPGGSNLSPGEIPNITTNVRGGLGVFGAFASQRTTFEVVE